MVSPCGDVSTNPRLTVGIDEWANAELKLIDEVALITEEALGSFVA